jgi:hypothetical protein
VQRPSVGDKVQVTDQNHVISKPIGVITKVDNPLQIAQVTFENKELTDWYAYTRLILV